MAAHSNAEQQAELHSLFERKDLPWSFLTFFISYAFYLFSAFPAVAAEDAGEFTAVVHTLGIAHPSGYPIYTILGKIFTVLVPFGNIAWRVNIFSAFFSAATVAGVYLFLKLVTKDTAIGILAALIFAGGEIFWSQAIRAEVYGLNTFFIILVLILSCIWFMQTELDRHESANKTFLWLSFIYGLSLANHHLMLMEAVPLALFVVMARPRILLDYRLILRALGLFLLGLSVYLYLPVRASYQPAVNWGNPVTWDGFWGHVTRKYYSAQALDPFGQLVSGSATTQPGNPVSDFFRYHVINFSAKFFGILDRNYSWIAGLLAAGGFAFLWKRSGKLMIYFLALVVFNAFILSALIGLGVADKLPVGLFTEQPFYIPLLLVIVLLAGMGIRYLNSIKYVAGIRTAPARVRRTAVIFLTLACVTVLALQFPSRNQSDNYIARDLALAELDALPENAVLHSENGDNTIFPILYLQKVENYRPDLTIYINSPINIYKCFIDLASMESDNPGKRIFADFPFVFYPDKKYISMGPVSEIVPAGYTGQAVFQYPDITVKGLQKDNLDHFNKYLVARYYLDTALTLSGEAQSDFFRKSFNFAPESRNITGQLIGNYYVRADKFEDAIPYLETAQKLMPDEYPIAFQLAVSYIQTGRHDQAETLVTGQNKENRQLMVKELNLLNTQQPGKYPALSVFLTKNSNML